MTKHLPTFNPMPDCQLCDLHDSATHPGIPTRAFAASGKSRALLVVGEAPGYREDQQSVSWIGPSGKLLQRFLEATRISKTTDIYLSNSCRCRPPMNADPTRGQAGKCRVHLAADIEKLCNYYPEGVTILCCGRWATFTISKLSSLKSAFSNQGADLSSFNTFNISPEHARIPKPVFFTYHPAMLMPGRNPALLPAVIAHFELLTRYFSGDFTPGGITVSPVVNPPVPKHMPPLVCLDIETYGILKGVEQTVFHPTKALHIDKQPIGTQVVTVAFGYEDPEGPSGYTTCVYRFDKDIIRIREWFHRMSTQNTLLIGQNIKFDLQFLRANDSVLNYWISPLRLHLDDTLLVSFLWYEQRPEKGLKELATLYGISDYTKLTVTGKTGTATSPDDPDLQYYNCLDVATTLALYKMAWQEIVKKYGPDNPKTSTVCRDIRNQILWCIILMETTGSCVDVPAIHKIHDDLCTEINTLIEQASEMDLILRGKGSKTSCLALITTAVEELGLINDSRLQLTPKTRQISINKENVNLILECLEPDSNYRLQPYLLIFQQYKTLSKLFTSYTNPLVNQPKKGIVHYFENSRKGMIYPSWYPMPAHAGKSDNSIEGGTIQARFSCKGPALQTFPSKIKHTMTSRYPYGVVLGYDLSQIELRIAALLSGDPIMLHEHNIGLNRHTQTGLLFAPDADINSKSFQTRERQLGKKLNFLVLFLGGAFKFQETAMQELGIHIELDRCQQIIDAHDAKYHVFRSWQASLIAEARRTGYVMLFTGWSRTFGRASLCDNYLNEICNMPIQAMAAQIMQSAQYAITCDLIAARLRARIAFQIIDAVYIDCPREEITAVDKIVDKHLTNPPLLTILSMELGRTVPMVYERTQL